VYAAVPVGSPHSGGLETRRLVPVALAVLGVLLILATVIVASSGGKASAGEVFLEAASATGQSPFTEPVDPTPSSTTTSSVVATPATPANLPTSGIAPPAGSKPYGGSGDDRVCDREKLVTFLTANPDRAKAWAGVLGVKVDQIPTYVRSLTPTVLLYDTRVTNHGFANGRATSLQSILQAGTAVLVDANFNPVVRCRCGNPLAAPQVLTKPNLVGTPWPGFSPTGVVSINNGVTVNVVINVLTPPTASSPSVPASSTTASTAPASSSTSTTLGHTPNTDTSNIEGLLVVLEECTQGGPVQVVDVQPDPVLAGTVTANLIVKGVPMQFTYTKEIGKISEGDQASADLLAACGVAQ
jgi:hypothetical protein